MFFLNPQRRSGKASSDVQILKIDEDLTGSRTEYMKVESLVICNITRYAYNICTNIKVPI